MSDNGENATQHTHLICNTDSAFSSNHIVCILDEISRVLHDSATSLQISAKFIPSPEKKSAVSYK